MPFRVYALVCGIAALAVTGCKDDPNVTKLMYMPDMVNSPTVKALNSYIDPPPHSLATNAILYGKTPDETEKVLFNPLRLSRDPKHLTAGSRLYGVYCSVCHGNDAKGKGRISDVFPQAPDITHKLYADRKDGYFFHRVTFGAAMMPGYGHAISPKERWQIILHLRQLQKGTTQDKG